MAPLFKPCPGSLRPAQLYGLRCFHEVAEQHVLVSTNEYELVYIAYYPLKRCDV